jgi:methyl-accepting chemotaxis protein
MPPSSISIAARRSPELERAAGTTAASVTSQLTARRKCNGQRTLMSIGQTAFSKCNFRKELRMSRLIISTLAVAMLSGCSVLDRVDMTIERLDIANNLLLRTNEQIATVSKQMVDTQALLVQSNKLVVESTRQVAASIKNVVQSNGKMDISNSNMTKSNTNMELTNENMTKTLAQMAESNKNVARSNALMTEMNEKLGVMTKVIEKIPGFKP